MDGTTTPFFLCTFFFDEGGMKDDIIKTVAILILAIILV